MAGGANSATPNKPAKAQSKARHNIGDYHCDYAATGRAGCRGWAMFFTHTWFILRCTCPGHECATGVPVLRAKMHVLCIWRCSFCQDSEWQFSIVLIWTCVFIGLTWIRFHSSHLNSWWAFIHICTLVHISAYLTCKNRACKHVLRASMHPNALFLHTLQIYAADEPGNQLEHICMHTHVYLRE